MANIKDSLKILYKLEFANRKTALHQNKGENGWTWKGIYQVANPNWDGWKVIRQKMQQYNGDMVLVSDMLYDNELLEEMTVALYKKEYWDKMKLDEVKSQKVADEMFILGVNIGLGNAIRVAQRACGAIADGVLGPRTVKALNEVDEATFDKVFDQLEVNYYAMIVDKNPAKAIYLNGWRNRAYAV